ncbi:MULTISPECIES: L-2-hydroxyglutarate oxidase [Bacillaceae]|uniref:Hydroxyglutarate oxidase n=1 Tax=Alkalicoccobacillus plakortidis TaxID=444060 RepID=A0A9D5DPI5_9BACI|nr:MULTISPECIES: L-2-hydroxyglutarate oxidase [Bacillaceae]KQL57904.1 hydroxyglutarate oxidase [Alkalicoccobacillus plakortidis]
MFDYSIIGGGIVGLSVAYTLQQKQPEARIQIIEKERGVACHQTGNNSGVIHSGIYYKPGSFKARFAKAGSESMRKFCLEHNLAIDICGKVIVATEEKELEQLHTLYQRGLDNGLHVELLSKQELVEIEPHVNGIAGIRVPTAGIVNYKQVSETLAALFMQKGGTLTLSEEVRSIEERHDHVSVSTDKKTYSTQFVINCAGLHSDRIANLAGYHLDMKIIPFRGEYYKLKPEKRYLVNHLIYPVPDPNFPFLGVHFTRMTNGEIDAGPNAVLSFKREGYKKTDLNVRDLAETLGYRGFWKIASKYMQKGMEEMHRSYSKKVFVKSLQKLIPAVREDDLIPASSGVRAQGLTVNGELVDDFHIVTGKRSLHICNAPSPAATAALEIGKEVGERMERLARANVL